MTDSLPDGTQSVACGLVDCSQPVKAKGLCATHYQRQRRTGDPRKVRRAGRPRSNDPISQACRESGIGLDWSPRTLARYGRSWRMIQACDGDLMAAVAKALRPNGDINVSKLERIAEVMLIQAWEQPVHKPGV